MTQIVNLHSVSLQFESLIYLKKTNTIRQDQPIIKLKTIKVLKRIKRQFLQESEAFKRSLRDKYLKILAKQTFGKLEKWLDVLSLSVA